MLSRTIDLYNTSVTSVVAKSHVRIHIVYLLEGAQTQTLHTS